MRRLLLLGWAVLLIATPISAIAGSVTLLWTVEAPTASTDVEQAICSGAWPGPFSCGNWAIAKNVATSTCAARANTSPVISDCQTGYTAPAGLILFRFTHKTTLGSTTRTDAGPWHNDAWTLPKAPTNVGAQ